MAVDEDPLEQLVRSLDRTVLWNVTVSGETLYLECGGKLLEGALTPILGMLGTLSRA